MRLLQMKAAALAVLSLFSTAYGYSNSSSANMLRAQSSLMGIREGDCPPCPEWYDMPCRDCTVSGAKLNAVSTVYCPSSLAVNTPSVSSMMANAHVLQDLEVKTVCLQVRILERLAATQANSIEYVDL